MSPQPQGKARSTACLIRSSSPGHMWAERLSVVAADACPSARCTVFTEHPPAINMLAKACRSAWHRRPFTPAAVVARRQ